MCTLKWVIIFIHKGFRQNSMKNFNTEKLHIKFYVSHLIGRLNPLGWTMGFMACHLLPQKIRYLSFRRNESYHSVLFPFTVKPVMIFCSTFYAFANLHFFVPENINRKGLKFPKDILSVPRVIFKFNDHLYSAWCHKVFISLNTVFVILTLKVDHMKDELIFCLRISRLFELYFYFLSSYERNEIKIGLLFVQNNQMIWYRILICRCFVLQKINWNQYYDVLT